MKEKSPTKLKRLVGPLTLKQRRSRYHPLVAGAGRERSQITSRRRVAGKAG